MLPLNDPRWLELDDAYETSGEIPELLKQLASHPADDVPEAEPYFSLWSALCHQGDIYTASYAAVPHLVAAIAEAPTKVRWTVFQMIACIEIARCNGRGPDIPIDLRDPYFRALAEVPHLVGSAAAGEWDHWYCGAALSALAAAKGFPAMAEAILELDPDTIKQMLDAKFGGG